MNGEYVEIEPGVIVFFRAMPLSDGEVMDRYAALKAALSACIREGDEARTQLDKSEGVLQERMAAWTAKHATQTVDAKGVAHWSLGDGRDAVKASPKTRDRVRLHKRTVEELDRRERTLRREVSYLERWYPVTLRKAAILKIAEAA